MYRHEAAESLHRRDRAASPPVPASPIARRGRDRHTGCKHGRERRRTMWTYIELTGAADYDECAAWSRTGRLRTIAQERPSRKTTEAAFLRRLSSGARACWRAVGRVRPALGRRPGVASPASRGGLSGERRVSPADRPTATPCTHCIRSYNSLT